MTAGPPGGARLIWIVAGVTGSLNVAVTLVVTATEAAFAAGDCVVTDGGVVSMDAVLVVKVHDVGAITFPAVSAAPDTLTAYEIAGVSNDAGVRVMVRVAAL